MSDQTHQAGFLHRFIQHAQEHPDALALHALDERRQISYAELHEMACRRKSVLTGLGLAPRSRVMLCLPSGVEFVANYLGAVGGDFIPILINDKLTGQEFATLARDARAAAIITTSAFAQKHAKTLTSLEDLQSLVTVDAGTPPELREGITRVGLPGADAIAQALTLPDKDTIVTVQYTYKGVGEPLPVAHRYQALTISSDGLLASMYPMGVGSVHLISLPLYAVYGLVVLMVMPLSIGATMLMTSSITRTDLVELLSKHRVTFACLVPELIRMLSAQLAERSAPLPPLMPDLMLYSGGSRLTAEAALELEQRLVRPKILQGYGMTESLPVIVQSYVGTSKPGAIGQAIPGVKVRVVDDHGDNVAPGDVGELLLSGPTITSGYIDRPAATARFFSGGWLHTGDLVRMDADGHIFFAGSRLRITKIRSQMVDLAEVERVAGEHPGVRLVRAYAERDAQGQTSLQLSVHCDGASSESLMAHLTERLSPFKLPRSISAVDQAMATA